MGVCHYLVCLDCKKTLHLGKVYDLWYDISRMCELPSEQWRWDDELHTVIDHRNYDYEYEGYIVNDEIANVILNYNGAWRKFLDMEKIRRFIEEHKGHKLLFCTEHSVAIDIAIDEDFEEEDAEV